MGVTSRHPAEVRQRGAPDRIVRAPPRHNSGPRPSRFSTVRPTPEQADAPSAAEMILAAKPAFPVEKPRSKTRAYGSM